MRKPQGYAFERDRFTGLVTREADTFTCSHCCKPVEVPPKPAPPPGGHCKACDALICDVCANKMAKGAVCATWVKRIEQLDNKLRFVENERERLRLFADM